jgi:hypothetical protein
MTKMTIKTTKKKNVVDGGNNGRVDSTAAPDGRLSDYESCCPERTVN